MKEYLLVFLAVVSKYIPNKKFHKERFYQNFQNFNEPLKYIESKLQNKKNKIIKFRNQINSIMNALLFLVYVNYW